MDWDLFIAVVAGFTVIVCLLALSVIHLFWIPKDILDRDTKPRNRPQPADASPTLPDGTEGSAVRTPAAPPPQH